MVFKKILYWLSISALLVLASTIYASHSQDNKISQQIKMELLRLGLDKIEVRVDNGIVYLIGEADFDVFAFEAVKVSQSILGVKNVIANELKVDDNRAVFTDTILEGLAVGLLEREITTPNYFGMPACDKQTLVVKNKTVYLDCLTDEKEYISPFVNIIKQVNGIKNIQYKLPPQILMHRILANKQLNRFPIDIVVKDQKIVIKGQLKRDQDVLFVVSTLQAMPGVKNIVTNHLKNSEQKPFDAYLIQSAKVTGILLRQNLPCIINKNKTFPNKTNDIIYLTCQNEAASFNAQNILKKLNLVQKIIVTINQNTAIASPVSWNSIP